MINLHYKSPEKFIEENLTVEKQRVQFLVQRDGLIRTLEFVERTHKLYRQCRKSGHGQYQLFSRSFIQSCIDFKKLMVYVNTYEDYLNTNVEKT